MNLITQQLLSNNVTFKQTDPAVNKTKICFVNNSQLLERFKRLKFSQLQVFILESHSIKNSDLNIKVAERTI